MCAEYTPVVSVRVSNKKKSTVITNNLILRYLHENCSRKSFKLRYFASIHVCNKYFSQCYCMKTNERTVSLFRN